MEITKAVWKSDGDTFSMQMPIAKINVERREVSGFATLDNPDQADDIVLAEASRKAFAKFRGNIREMHQPIAAGKLLKFTEKQMYDADTGRTYNGIYVTVHISKGAESTWQKVLDGTLTGFSIGGGNVVAETVWNKDFNKNMRIVKGYDLGELSLVDNPCNQLSNIASIQKSADGSVMTGMVAETEVVNLFYCENDEIFEKSTEESATCMRCDADMTNAGWFEKGADDDQEVKEIVQKFLRHTKEDNATIEKQAEPATGEGGVQNMTENAPEETTAAPAEENTGVTETVEGGAAEVIEEVGTQDEHEVNQPAGATADPVDEVVTDEPDLEKMFATFRGEIEKAFDTKVQAVTTEVTKSLDEKVSEVLAKVDSLSETLSSVKGERESVTKRLDALESSTAIKKSVSVEDDEDKKVVQKGLWSGTILG